MSGKIRIVGGQWRGRKLSVPEHPGLRPTGDRVRETLFNWLQPRIVGARCLDLFAGTGALGLEAASRGASRVVLVEQDSGLVEALRQARQWPGGQVVEVCHADALYWLGDACEAFDVIFLDPPFGSGLQARALAAVVEQGMLAPDGWIYVEEGVDEAVAVEGAFEIVRDKQIGQVRARLLRQAGAGSV
ncbi:16S rRNA (guanine(966)-N(2))-methyltransferase RsmD [Wenzhouxiangella sp. AB-CW3]|uniref:16S rRNA (guanine(966)-N(2))-methyltransferase RsmD n=1 Tax=Wenzhouxiangella sp. AB-CW3 TaxID=2771012 RepID=UPI001CC2E5EA|nr:16S rRNA (guanine(966)-N(2))-methyltransferase RsmD [Wenzhouxiangella sp. AB-CW3]